MEGKIEHVPKLYCPTTVPMDKNVAKAKSAIVSLSPTKKVLSPSMGLQFGFLIKSIDFNQSEPFPENRNLLSAS